MIPATRKELYLNKIVGDNDYSIPEKPISEEELFFAEILGEAVQAPEPLTRYQMYLAKIAGRDVEIPTPITRLEFFLAKAAEMDITVPVPITREEIFWSNYSAIVDFEVEGVPPLTYKAIEGTLKNYRIYGNTVNGESVGDRTGNLFDLNTWANTIRNINGNGLMSISGNTISITSVNSTDCFTMPYVDSQIGVYKIPVKPNTIYTVNWYGSKYRILLFKNGTLDRIYTYDTSDDLRSFTTDSDATFITIRFGVKPTNPVGTTATISDFMISEGSTALPYEPYGYKMPVTVSNGTDAQTIPIYLPEQIRKVGDEAEYIDYGEQKWHRVRKNLLQNTATSQTINGVTFTVNEDGSVTCNGTASGTAECRLAYNFSLPAGNYCLTGIPPSGSASSYYLRAWYNSSGSIVWINDYGKGRNFTLTDTTKMYSSIVVWSGKVLDNITFYPMIRKADIEDDTYEPYIENTEVDVTLPALPTLSGTNTLTVGTEVQPSKVYIKGEKEREYT